MNISNEEKLYAVLSWAEQADYDDHEEPVDLAYKLFECFEINSRLTEKQLKALDNLIEECNIELEDFI